MKTVPAPQVATPSEAMNEGLPESVQFALGDLAGAAREGLLALSVGVGLGVMCPGIHQPAPTILATLPPVQGHLDLA